MKAYTARFAHLERLPEQPIGDLVLPRDKIGRMGSTGQSAAPHLHLDVICGHINYIVRLEEIGYEDTDFYKPNIRQLNFFLDGNLFNTDLVITTYFYDPSYKLDWGKEHPGYDCVPENRHLEPGRNFDIFWNRSKTGIVLDKGSDTGYGNYILVGFEA